MVAIIAVALVLRLAGIWFGRPYVYHPDEWAVAKPAMEMTRAGDWDPRLYLYPSGLIYAERLLVSAVQLVRPGPLETDSGPGAGGLPSIGDQNFLPSQFKFVLVGRILVALLGASAVGLVYLAARRLTSPAGALTAAALLAVASVHVVHSHYLTTDVPASAATALTLWLALEGSRRGPRWLIAAGFAAGIAASIKYNAGLVLLVPLVIHAAALTQPRSVAWQRFVEVAIAITAAAIAGFVLLTPALVFDTSKVFDAIVLQARVYATGHPGAEGDSVAFYLSFFWPPVIALVGLGFLGALRRRTAGDLAVVVFAVAYLVLISIPLVRFSRNLEPVLPFVAVLGGLGAGLLFERTREVRMGSAAALVLIVAVVGNASATSVDNDVHLLRDDTRSRALAWILEHVPAGTTIIREDFTPQVPSDLYRVGFAGILSDRRIQDYEQMGARYLIASSAEFERFTEPGWQRGFYERLLTMPIVHDERPTGTTTGPRIVIIDLAALRRS